MMMRSLVLDFHHDIGVDDMVYSDWSIYCKKIIDSGDLIITQDFITKDDLVNVFK